MCHARSLLSSRPMRLRMPDQSLIAGDHGSGSTHIQAARGEDGSYAIIYSAAGLPIPVSLERLTGSVVHAQWFDPRNGSSIAIGDLRRQGVPVFTPPTCGPGCDWVLVLDAVA